MKRLFDIVLALIAAPFALVLVLACSVAIRRASPGPVLFKQVRIGTNEMPFVCYKLRTMYVHTPHAPSHHMTASSVTPAGLWLRRLKLDELPQLWNILRGEMSFVGPRPCLPSQVELIAARRARGLAGLSPGITGVSQVAGVDMSDPERLAILDATYLKDMSIFADLRLILQTALGAGRGDRVSN